MSYLTEEELKEKEREQQRRQARQQIVEHSRKSLVATIFDVRWVPQSASYVAIGQYPNSQGALCHFQLEKGEIVTLREMRKPTALKCCTFGHSSAEGRQLATGDFAGNVDLWDVERGMEAPVASFKRAHDTIINGIDGALYGGPPEIATCSRDGAVKVWDARQPAKPVVALQPVDQSKARDCWTVRLGNSCSEDDRVLCAGYDNGDVKLFDLKTQKMLHEFNVSNGVCDLCFDRPDIEMNKLIVSSLEGRVRVYDLRTLNPEVGFAYVEDRVSTGTVWVSKPLPQNRDIFMSGGAGELTLSRYVYPPERSLKDPTTGVARGVAGTIDEINKARVGDQPINAMDWHPQREGLLVTAALDQTMRVMVVTKMSALS